MKYLLTGFLMCLFLCALAQDTPVYHPIDRSEWQQAVQDVFYVEKMPEPENQDLPLPEPNGPMQVFDSIVWQVIACTLVAALLIFILLRIFGKGLFSNTRVTPAAGNVLSDLDERPMETDLDRYLREALESADYKMAVRIYYLMLLCALEENGSITWQKEKTNHDYLRELSAHPSFRKLQNSTRVFEFVWYGDRLLNKDAFTTVQNSFIDLLQQLPSRP